MKYFYDNKSVFCVLFLSFVITLMGFASLMYAAGEAPVRKVIFRKSMTNPYVVLIDLATGDVVDKTTGVNSSSETWESNAITATQHGESDFWYVTLPSDLNENAQFLLCIGDNASPVETDDVEVFYYSARTNQAFNTEYPSRNGRVLVGE